MKASARNQFSGTIAAIQAGEINDEVELKLADGTAVLAMITHASKVRLGLEVGKPVIGLVKASSIVLVDDVAAYAYSARNQLSGTVSAVEAGAVNTEVEIQVSASVSIVAIITNQSASDMGLAAGSQVTALFKSSSVILAVAK